MVKTADKLMDLAQDYIQTRGYNAFSYKDLAHDLGIKTSSIHYHFPKKADLGAAIVRRYNNEFKELYGGEVPVDTDHKNQFETYLAPFIAVSESQVKICICGALGGEFSSLPETVQKEVVNVINYHEFWLSSLLKSGKKAGVFTFEDDPQSLARVIFSMLQGALTLSRAKQDSAHFENAVLLAKKAIGL